MTVMATINGIGVYTTEFVGDSNIAAAFGPPLPAPYDTITCRSIGLWQSVVNIWYFTIVGDVNGDTITFKVYDAEDDMVYDCFETVIFQDGETIGEPTDPFLLTFTTPVREYSSTIPAVFKLGQNYPNPFNPETKISYEIPKPSNVELVIYNIKGERVRTLVNEYHNKPGYYYEIWNGKDNQGKDVASGVYFYTIKAADYISTKKMLLMK